MKTNNITFYDPINGRPFNVGDMVIDAAGNIFRVEGSGYMFGRTDGNGQPGGTDDRILFWRHYTDKTVTCSSVALCHHISEKIPIALAPLVGTDILTGTNVVDLLALLLKE